MCISGWCIKYVSYRLSWLFWEGGGPQAVKKMPGLNRVLEMVILDSDALCTLYRPLCSRTRIN